MTAIRLCSIRFTKSLQSQRVAIDAWDAKLAEQLRRALIAVGLNLGEGYGASGGGKSRAYRIALGEASELEMGLEVAAALGYWKITSEQRESLQRIIATLNKLARPCR